MSPDELLALLEINRCGTDSSAMVPFSLIEMELIVETSMRDGHQTWELTEGGKMMIRALCQVKPPIKKWTMP